MRINKNLSFENIDGQLVVMNESDESFGNSKALVLNQTATFIFECIKRGLDYDTIIKEIVFKFNIEQERAKEDFYECIEVFKNKRILL